MWVLYQKNGGKVVAASSDSICPWKEDDYLGVVEKLSASVDLATTMVCDGAEIREPTVEELAAIEEKEAEDLAARNKEQAIALFKEAASPFVLILKALQKAAEISDERILEILTKG